MNTAYTCVLLTLCNSSAGNLNHKAWKVRDSAHSTLHSVGWVAVPLLERLRSSSFSPEVRERADRLLYPYANSLADRDSHKLSTFALPQFHVWDAKSGWVWDVRFLRFYQTGYDLTESLRLWVKSQILQRRPRAEIMRDLSIMRAWREE